MLGPCLTLETLREQEECRGALFSCRAQLFKCDAATHNSWQQWPAITSRRFLLSWTPFICLKEQRRGTATLMRLSRSLPSLTGTGVPGALRLLAYQCR